MSAIPPPGPPRASPPEARIDSWTSYWRGGALHSCAGSFDGNYAGPLRDFWLRVFDALEPSARVLDACCGNAPLSQLLVAHPRFAGGSMRIDAVDLAEVAPPWLPLLPEAAASRIAVHPRVDVGLLPFDADCFALCMSQYGVEYAGPQALVEIRRVLRPGGEFAALVHHAEALPVRIAREELEHAAWIADCGLGERVAELIEPMARSASPEGQATLRGDALANDRRAHFNGILQRLQERVAASRYPDLLGETRDALMAVLQRARLAGIEAAEDALEHCRQAHARSLLRQQELVEHAMDAGRLEHWLEAFGAAERRVETVHFGNGELAGWGVRVQRVG